MSRESVVFTIGYSTHTLAAFVALLRRHKVTAVADVRSVPYSRLQPQYNREVLAEALSGQGMAYAFLGAELGARSNDKACYENGKVQYRRLAKSAAFRSGLERVRRGSENHQIALMCAEREPLECHRALLVARELAAIGVSVAHIHADGHLEPHEDAVRRLLELIGLKEDLFRSQLDVIDEAYARQEVRVAYVDNQLVRKTQEAEL